MCDSQALRNALVQFGFGHDVRLFGDFVQCAKYRQLVTKPHQLLNGDIDDVRACIDHPCRFMGNTNGQFARLRIGIGLDAQKRADRLVMAV